MRKGLGIVTALALASAPMAASIVFASPASACTGDPCDGFCYTWTHVPSVSPKVVLGGKNCPIE